MTWKVVTPKASFFYPSQAEAEEQAALIQYEWKLPTFIHPLAKCSACGGDREDDLTFECNGCLMEMAEELTKN